MPKLPDNAETLRWRQNFRELIESTIPEDATAEEVTSILHTVENAINEEFEELSSNDVNKVADTVAEVIEEELKKLRRKDSS